MNRIREQGLGEGLRLGALLLAAAVLLTAGFGGQGGGTRSVPTEESGAQVQQLMVLP